MLLNYDVICLSETLTDDPKTLISNTKLAGHIPLVKKAKTTKSQYGGFHGLCLLIKNGVFMDYKILENLSSDGILWVRLITTEKVAFVLGCVYIHLKTQNFTRKVF